MAVELKAKMPKVSKGAKDGKDSKDGKGKPKGPSTKERQSFFQDAKGAYEQAKTICVRGGHKKLKAEPEQFSTGRNGFMASNKAVVDVGPVPLTLPSSPICL